MTTEPSERPRFRPMRHSRTGFVPFVIGGIIGAVLGLCYSLNHRPDDLLVATFEWAIVGLVAMFLVKAVFSLLPNRGLYTGTGTFLTACLVLADLHPLVNLAALSFMVVGAIIDGFARRAHWITEQEAQLATSQAFGQTVAGDQSFTVVVGQPSGGDVAAMLELINRGIRWEGPEEDATEGAATRLTETDLGDVDFDAPTKPTPHPGHQPDEPPSA